MMKKATMPVWMTILISAIWMSALFFWIGPYSSAATIAAQAERLANLSSFWRGIMLGGYGLTLALIRVPIGFAATRYSNKLLIGIGLLFVAGGNMAVFSFPESIFPLFISKMAFGLGIGCWVIYSILYAQNYLAIHGQGIVGEARRELTRKAMAKISTTHALGVALAVTAGGFIVQQWGWHMPFLIGAISALLAAALLFLVKEEKKPEQPPLSWGYLRQSGRRLIALCDKKRIAVSLAAGLVFFILTSTGWGFTQNLVRDAAPWQLSIIGASMVIPYALGIRYSYLLRRWTNEWMFTIFFGAAGIAIFAIPFSESILFLSLLHAVIGGTLGSIFSRTMSLAVEELKEKQWSEAMGLYQTGYALGFLLGPVTAGIIGSRWGLSSIFHVDGALTIAVALCIGVAVVRSQIRQARVAETADEPKTPVGV